MASKDLVKEITVKAERTFTGLLHSPRVLEK